MRRGRAAVVAPPGFQGYPPAWKPRWAVTRNLSWSPHSGVYLPPPNDHNAYNGGTNAGASTEVSGAGLNQDAIVGVRLDGTDYNAPTWNVPVTPGQTGIQTPVLTGMVKESDLASGVSISLLSPPSDGSSGGYVATLDDATVKYGDTGVSVSSTAWALAGSGGYVPFEISVPRLGRGLGQNLSGPLGSSPDTGVGAVGYSLTGSTALVSPYTQVNLPAYTPPTPVVTSDNPTGAINVTLNGAFQVTDASNANDNPFNLKIYDTNSDLLWQGIGELAPLPTGAWNGLAVPYSFNIALGHDLNGDIIGVNGDFAGPLNILQNFLESGVTSDSGYDSGTVGVQ